MRPLLAAAIALAAALVAAPRLARAVERPCPDGQFWDLNRGACVKKQKVKRRSPEETYYAALDHLDGRARNASPARGVELLGQACRARLGVACTQLAFLHLRGRGGVTADPARAITFYEQACGFGDHDGCVGAAEMWSSGVLGKIEHERAIPVLDRACTAGSGRACHALAYKYDWALGVAADGAKARALYERSFGLLDAECDRGVAASCALVGLHHRDGNGVPKNMARAVAVLDKGCKGGSGDACYNLGFLADAGDVTGQPDRRRAHELFRQACDRYDHADGCFKAGAMLALGEVAGDLATIEPAAIRACELSQFRCDLRGYITGEGIGVAQDLAASLRWYDVACGHGNGVACRVMGSKHEHAIGTPANGKRAVEYYEKACELEEWIGCSYAGKLHYRGDSAQGLRSDPARAYELLHIGCVRNDHESCQWAGELLTEGTDGTGVKKPDRGVAYFEQGCTLGRGQSCSWAGELYQDGRATGRPDLKRAVELYAPGCFAEVEPATFACRRLAELRRDGSVARDLLEAARALTVACHLDGGLDCTDADAALKDAGAGDADKRALVAAMDAACVGPPRNESACNNHALLLRTGGYATGTDLKDSTRRFGESCERGNQHACWMWGESYEHGWGVVADLARAQQIYTRACDGGFTRACFALASVLRETGKQQEALRLFWRACDEGNGTACNMVGFAHYTAQGVTWDVAEATRLYEKGCELGDAVACSNVGELYEYGIVKDPDATQAFAHYEKSCLMGFRGGCARAAQYIERGEGGAEQDDELAEELYRGGCEDGMPEACRNLAALLERLKKASASELARTRQRAFDHAKQQADQNPYYRWVLGTFHRDGIATVRDATAATVEFVGACEGYDPLGCLDAGRMYLAGGDGLARDPERAAAQLDKACAANVAEACRLATEARGGGKVPPVTKRGSGCACDAGAGGGAGAGAGLLALLVGAVLGARRRRRGRAG